MKRLSAAFICTVLVLGSGIAHATHAGPEPSKYCDGTTPGADAQHPPVKVSVNGSQPTVCFNATGGLKGAVWADMDSRSVVVDGDTNNANSSRCLGGYAGARASDGEDPTLLFSQSGNYDPKATATSGKSSPNNTFDPTKDSSLVTSCVVG